MSAVETARTWERGSVGDGYRLLNASLGLRTGEPVIPPPVEIKLRRLSWSHQRAAKDGHGYTTVPCGVLRKSPSFKPTGRTRIDGSVTPSAELFEQQMTDPTTLRESEVWEALLAYAVEHRPGPESMRQLSRAAQIAVCAARGVSVEGYELP